MTRDELQNILQRFSISHRDERKATNINCPFCLGRTSRRPDTMFRCGIFSNLRFHCWRCHRTGTFYEILLLLAGVDNTQYTAIVRGERAQEDKTPADIVREKLADPQSKPVSQKETVALPPALPVNQFLVDGSYPLRMFLRRRGLTIDTCKLYGALYTGEIGDYSHRLVVPIYDGLGRLTAWQGRDVTGLSKRKYLTQGLVMDALYWAAHVEPPYRMYVVEGIFDCWRMETNAIATFSNQLTHGQKGALLWNPLIKELVFCWDGDSYAAAFEAARQIAPLVRAGAVRLPAREDPDSLGRKAVLDLEIRWA